MARLFDGIDDYLWNSGTTAFTAGFPRCLGCWFDTNNGDANHDLLTVGGLNPSFQRNMYSVQWINDVSADGNRVALRIEEAGAISEIILEPDHLTTDGFGFIAAIFRSSTSASLFYRKGTGDLQISNDTGLTARTPFWDRAEKTILGADITANVDIDGNLAHAFTGMVAPTDEEMRAISYGISPRLFGMNHYWRLDGSSPELDTIGTIDLTLVSAPTHIVGPAVLEPHRVNTPFIPSVVT